MKHYVVTCAVLAAVIWAGGVASSASAAAPEFGACVAKAGGKYATSNCTTEVAGKTKYEWKPGPGPKNHFTDAIKAETFVAFESVGGTKIVCRGATGSGEIANAKEVGDIVWVLTGCSTSGVPCHNGSGFEGEITTNALSGGLGVEKVGETALKNKIAEELHGTGAEQIFVEFACSTIRIVVRGPVLHPVEVNKMLLTYTEKYTAKKGKQKPDKFAGGEPQVLEWSTAGGPFEQVGLMATLVQTYEEKIEINTVV